jgi:hypothetical protein
MSDIDLPFPQQEWGDFWMPPVEDDAPFPLDVELDFDTRRWRYIINRAQYRAALDVWLVAQGLRQ